jgi:2-keto-4-pentenoate hydratase/2-oxohepta-3-ene-1,7-dioic acid hydratase in catechol pathway
VKLVVFTRHEGPSAPILGALSGGVVVPLQRLDPDPQRGLEQVIDRFDDVRESFERAVREAQPLSLAEVRLHSPVPRPGKILCSTASYEAASAAERPPLLMTLKSAESVVGPDQTVHLPDVGDQWQFIARAELGLVVRGPARRVPAADWRSAVFGYTCAINVTATGDTQFGRDFWLAKSDTLNPLGACIATADEVMDPQEVRVTSTVNAGPAQDYSMTSGDYTLGEQVEFITTVMTLKSGDVLTCGGSNIGLRPLGNGDSVEVRITGVGQLGVRVAATSGVTA